MHFYTDSRRCKGTETQFALTVKKHVLAQPWTRVHFHGVASLTNRRARDFELG